MRVKPNRSFCPCGVCHCGCGQVPPLAKRTDSAIGWIKGRPQPCVPGHQPTRPDNAARNRSPEVRAKVSLSHKGKPKPYMRERLRNPELNPWALMSSERRTQKIVILHEVRPKAGHRNAESRAKTAAASSATWRNMAPAERIRQLARLRRDRTGQGWTQSAEARARISAAKRNYWASLSPEELQRRIDKDGPRLLALRIAMLPNVKPTSIERLVAGALDTLGEGYKQHEPFGAYVVDFYLPDRRLDLECDGTYWHSLPKVQARDRRRDGWFKWKGYAVVRLKESDIRTDALACVKAALGM